MNSILQKLKNIIRYEKVIRIFRFLCCFCPLLILFVDFGGLFFYFLIPLLFILEYGGLTLQKRFFNKIDNEISDDSLSGELYLLHHSLKEHRKENNILTIIIILFFGMICCLRWIRFLGMNRREIVSLTFLIGILIVIYYTISNWTILARLKKYSELLNKEISK